MNKLHFFKDYLIEKYGKPLYRIPIDLPLSCPNRENNSGRGCIYCADDGNRARHLRHNLSLGGQVHDGIDYATRRYQAEPPYIAYFQSFSNTYGEVEQLRQYYNDVLALADFAVVIISTRPDCLPVPVLDLLSELNNRYELWIELGVQTSNDETLEIIRRGHRFEAVKQAAATLSERGIRCAAHVILGLPGESASDFRQTAVDIAALPFSAVKIHNLLVLKNTPLAKMYANPAFTPSIKPLNEYEYAAAAVEFLKLIPDRWNIMRLTADADEKEIIAPKWWMKKGQFLEFFKDCFDKISEGAFQGVKTEDGSFTLYHPEFRQHFHTVAGAETEAVKKFTEPSKLELRLKEKELVTLLDIGFGLGHNVVEAVKVAEKTGAGRLAITTLEYDLRTLTAAQRLFPSDSLHCRIISALLENGCWQGNFSEVKLIAADARKSVCELKDKFDIIFMDGFSPDKNPELWSFDFIRQLKKLISRDGILTTYSSAYPVRGALLRAGFNVGESNPFGRKRSGTVAALSRDMIEIPLNEKELNIILRSTAGAAYRDSGLDGQGSELLEQRVKLVKKLRERGVPKWHK